MDYESHSRERVAKIHRKDDFMGFLANIYKNIKKITSQAETPQNPPNSEVFFDVEIDGTNEKKQKIPPPPKIKPKVEPKTEPKISYTTPLSQTEISRNNFLRDMQKYEHINAEPAEFAPFTKDLPTYASMTRPQKAWYFYWRSLVRNYNFVNTDLSYIFVYIYELLSGIGWQTTEDGLDLLLNIWLEYSEQFPKLDNYMAAWVLDFVYIYNLPYPQHLENGEFTVKNYTAANIVIAKYADQVPIQLPFPLIITLCDYAVLKSEFYNQNKELMQQTIPIIITLLDTALYQSKKAGILAIYGPPTATQQEHTIFANAICPLAGEKKFILQKPYSTHPKLRKYISEVVKFTENILRDIRQYRKNRRLHVDLDKSTEKLILNFLQPQPTETPPTEPIISEEPVAEEIISEEPVAEETIFEEPVAEEIIFEEPIAEEIIFEEPIAEEIISEEPVAEEIIFEEPVAEEIIFEEPIAKETIFEEPVAEEIIFEEPVAEEIIFEEPIAKETIFEEPVAEEIIFEEEISEETPQAISLNFDSISQLRKETEAVKAALWVENAEKVADKADISDLPDIKNPENNPPAATFSTTQLSAELSEFAAKLTQPQLQVLQIIAKNPANQAEQIHQIAENAFTMPEIILDEINSLAIEILGDILVDCSTEDPSILEEFETLQTVLCNQN